MKLEKDHGHGVQTPSRKSFNPFDSDDEDSNSYVRTNVSYDIKSFEENAESLTFHLDTDDLSWEEAILAHAQVADHKIESDKNGEEVLYRKDTKLFTDKTVTECEVPGFIVCYKDDAYNSIKDIGIDNGVPTHEKVCIETRDNEETKSPPTFHDDLGLENENSVKEGSLDRVVFESQQCEDQHGTGDSNEMNISDVVCETRDSELSESDNLSKVEKTGIEATEEEHRVTLELPRETSGKSSIPTSPEVIDDSNKNPNKEAISSQSTELQETGDSSIGSVLTYNSKVESGSIILDFKSPASTVVEKEEEKKEEEIETVIAKPPVSQMMFRMDDKVHNGDTSFSAATIPTSSITYMGSHARTGSVSIRSESSAGSTRSFAFPVLQAEWNSSPVRMTKEEQRQMRKQRGWFNSFACC